MTLDEKKSERYITKDSGARQQFSTGMQRDITDGKARFDLIYPVGMPLDETMLGRWAALLARGARKYLPRNWEKAATQEELDRAHESAARHFAQWMAGETDEDHASAVYFNVQLAEFIKWKLRPPVEVDHASAPYRTVACTRPDCACALPHLRYGGDRPPDPAPGFVSKYPHPPGDLRAFWDSQSEWSQATFSADAERGPVGPLKHLAEEVLNELLGVPDSDVKYALGHVGSMEHDPHDLTEYADCLTLIFDAARRAGFTFEQLVKATLDKHEVNKARTWEKAAPGEPSHHVKGAP